MIAIAYCYSSLYIICFERYYQQIEDGPNLAFYDFGGFLPNPISCATMDSKAREILIGLERKLIWAKRKCMSLHDLPWYYRDNDPNYGIYIRTWRCIYISHHPSDFRWCTVISLFSHPVETWWRSRTWESHDFIISHSGFRRNQSNHDKSHYGLQKSRILSPFRVQVQVVQGRSEVRFPNQRNVNGI